MMRLVLLTGPVCSALSGLVIGAGIDWCLAQFMDIPLFNNGSSSSSDKKTEIKTGNKDGDSNGAASSAEDDKAASGKKSKKTLNKPDSAKKGINSTEATTADQVDLMLPLKQAWAQILGWYMGLYTSSPVRMARKLTATALAFLMIMSARTYGPEFWDYSHQMAEQLSSPSIMFHAQLRDGTTITVDDYRQAYWWLRDNTPQDARVMAWGD
jgi:dolichyl-diphosphooligosaccharide--protein glycosyltransferase